MSSKETPIRVLGQRSISTSFLNRSSNPFKSSNEDARLESSRSKRMSLSDFLDRKLPDTSLPPGTVKGKSRPFLSLLGLRDTSGSNNGNFEASKTGDAQTNRMIDTVVFEQFKHTDVEKGENVVSGCVDEAVYSIADDMQEQRKRKNLRDSGNENRNAKKHVVVIGGDPKPKRKGRMEILVTNKRTKPLYNHYANGRGWWDCDMEGVDSEEVGFGEVWEGVGSTTFGGIEWH